MKSDQEIMNSIRAAIDDCTRGIEEAPSLQYQIARKVKGEEPVVKKISASAILVIALIILSMAAALAAGFGLFGELAQNPRGDSSEKTWLIRIAINGCRDYRRSAWYRYIDFRVSIDQLPFLSSAPPSDDHIALTMAIMKLKPKYMEVVLLYFYEGYPIKEIAKMLNLTDAAVSSRIHKAKQKLKAELEGGEDDEK